MQYIKQDKDQGYFRGSNFFKLCFKVTFYEPVKGQQNNDDGYITGQWQKKCN